MEQTIAPQKGIGQSLKQFIGVADVPDVEQLLNLAFLFKEQPHAAAQLGQNKTIVMVYFNPSLRTRMSTTKAAIHLGLSVMNFNAKEGWNIEFEDGLVMNGDKAEHIREAAAVLSQYGDLIAVRCFPGLQDRAKDYAEVLINQFVKYASVPIINLESATRHPLQSLTDLMTIRAFQKKTKPKIVLTWAPHPKVLPQAVANSFLEWMYAAKEQVTITHPKGYELAPEFCYDFPIEYDQERALADADFVYVKNWSAYNDYGKVLSPSKNWMIDQRKMSLTKAAYLMHCLPVRRNVVISDEVLNSQQSLVIEQAKNRTFAAQAVLASLLKK